MAGPEAVEWGGDSGAGRGATAWGANGVVSGPASEGRGPGAARRESSEGWGPQMCARTGGRNSGRKGQGGARASKEWRGRERGDGAPPQMCERTGGGANRTGGAGTGTGDERDPQMCGRTGGDQTERREDTGREKMAQAVAGAAAPETARRLREGERGLRVLDLFCGIGTGLAAALAAGARLDIYHCVELDPAARAMAEAHAERLAQQYGRAAVPGDLWGAGTDVADLSQELDYDVVTAGWPCQDVSRARVSGRGLRGSRSGLYHAARRALRAVQARNPQASYVFENVNFEDRHPEDWENVKRDLGEALVCDAASLGPAHRVRAYWHNLGVEGCPTGPRVTLAESLDPGRRPRIATRTDTATSGRIALNTAGETQVAFPTLTAHAGSWAERRGETTVLAEDGSVAEPTMAELERLAGVAVGATAAQGVGPAERRRGLGNIWDGRMYTWWWERIREVARPAHGGGGAPLTEGSQLAAPGRVREAWDRLDAAWADLEKGEARAGRIIPPMPPRALWSQPYGERHAWERVLLGLAITARQGEGRRAGEGMLHVWRDLGVEPPSGEGCLTEDKGNGEEPSGQEERYTEHRGAGRQREEGSDDATSMDPWEAGAVAEAFDPGPPPDWFTPGAGKLRAQGWATRGGMAARIAREGARFLFERAPPRTDRPRYTIDPAHLPMLKEELVKLEDLGVVEWAPVPTPPDWAHTLNPWGVVPKKGTTEYRPVIDCTASGLNDAMLPLPMDLPTPETVLTAVERGWVLGKRDMRHGFYHVELHADHRRYAAFEVEGRLGRFRGLPMGARQSPALFYLVSAALGREIEEALGDCRVFVYLDDILTACPPARDMRRVRAIMDEVASKLGVEWKRSKDEGFEAQTRILTFLGIEINTEGPYLRIDPDKRTGYATAVREAIRAGRAGELTADTLRKLAGQLTWASRALRWGRGFLTAAWDALTAQGPVITWTRELEDDLAFFELALQGRTAWEGRTVWASQGARELTKYRHYFVAATDASGTWGWGGHWGQEEAAGKWGSDDLDTEHITVKELKAILMAVRLWGEQWRGGRVLIYTDNTAAMAIVNSGRAKAEQARDTLRGLALTCTHLEIDLRAEHIKGKSNIIADALSRGERPPARAEYTLASRLYALTGPHEIDAYSGPDHFNRQALQDRGNGVHWFTEERPAEAADLAGRRVWMYPPYSQISNAIQLAIDAFALDHDTVIHLALPTGEIARSRAWYRRYVEPPPFRGQRSERKGILRRVGLKWRAGTPALVPGWGKGDLLTLQEDLEVFRLGPPDKPRADTKRGRGTRGGAGRHRKRARETEKRAGEAGRD